jgi:hypothetical protein
MFFHQEFVLRIKQFALLQGVIFRCFLGMVFILLAACSNTQSNSPLLMPTAIIVRNNSGSDYASVTVAAVAENNQSPRAFGELAPVPDGVEQYYGRPTRAAPLPDIVEFRLQTFQGQTISRILRLNALTQQATRLSAPYAVVFSVQPGAVITPLLENMH